MVLEGGAISPPPTVACKRGGVRCDIDSSGRGIMGKGGYWNRASLTKGTFQYPPQNGGGNRVGGYNGYNCSLWPFRETYQILACNTPNLDTHKKRRKKRKIVKRHSTMNGPLQLVQDQNPVHNLLGH